MNSSSDKLGLFGLTNLVIGSIIGGGLFDLMRDMAQGAGPGAIMISWIIASIGTICLGLTFKNLTMKRPDLNAGMYSYAQAGFGKYMGFNSALGYWISNLLGDVGYTALLTSTVGFFLPNIFGNGQNWPSVILASVFLWATVIPILKGVNLASFMNDIITVAKLVPIVLFIIIMIIAFKWNIFTADFWSTPGNKFSLPLIATQVSSTLAVIFWCIDGVYSANVYASSAKKRSDVGKATILGVITVILIYALITLLSFGVMNRSHLAHLNQPAMGQVLKSVVGPWGAIVVNIGLVISLLGALLSWQKLTSALPQIAAENHVFPKFFAKTNQRGVQSNSLIITSIVTQVFIFSYLFAKDAYIASYTIASTGILIPLMLACLYQIKYTWEHRVDGRLDQKNLWIGIISTLFTVYGLISIAPQKIFGVSEILMIPVLFLIGIPMYWYLQKHDNRTKRICTLRESLVMIIIIGLAVGTIIKIIV